MYCETGTILKDARRKLDFYFRRPRYYIWQTLRRLGNIMSKTACVWLAISSFCSLAVAVAPIASPIPPMRPPQFLNVYRESVKAANIDAYDAIEREAVHTCKGLKCPNAYFAFESGVDTRQVWFLSLFDSQQDLDRVAAIYAQNAELNAAMARIAESKEDIVTPPENTVVKYREDLSRDFGVDFPHARILTITVIRVREGHLGDFEERQKLINRAAGNRDSESAVARPVGLVYQGASADAAQTFFVILPRNNRSPEERSRKLASTKPRDAALEAEIDRLRDVAIVSSEAASFGIRPDFSYLPRDWIAADPDFWSPAGIRD
jgi:hypothetical protein